MNTINIIEAYRLSFDRSFWCFDDDQFGLKQELFMHGASGLISHFVGDAERATFIFSTTQFPNHNVALDRSWVAGNPEKHGCEYTFILDGVKGSAWLCPAFCYYFGTERAPDKIYAKITPCKSAG
jgi:hypothetical protein